MPNVVFFSFDESDRETVLLIKGRAENPNYSNLNFRVQDLLKRWDTYDTTVIKQAISKNMMGTSRTIVFIGNNTHNSRWVAHEVETTLMNNKPVYAIRLTGTYGEIPKCISDHNIVVHDWSEDTLQYLATR